MAKTKIMILGTFHMAGSNDVFGVDIGNIQSDKHQKEIQTIVENLKGYHPTKIAFEQEYKYNDELNVGYRKYFNGELQLTNNEVHQIGFRLAISLHHKEIYGIDWMEQGVGIYGYGEVYDYAKNNQPELFRLINEYMGPKESISEDSSITDILINLNSPENVYYQQAGYLNHSRIGIEEDYMGIGWLMWWYQRNLIIFTNLAKIIENKEERILLLIGASHIGILSGFLEQSNLFEMINLIDYLKTIMKSR